MASSFKTDTYVDWHVYERDLARVEKQFESLYTRLDRLASAIENLTREDRANRTVLRAEWIKLVTAFVAGAIPTIVVTLIVNS
jgi:hypothetical protein